MGLIAIMANCLFLLRHRAVSSSSNSSSNESERGLGLVVYQLKVEQGQILRSYLVEDLCLLDAQSEPDAAEQSMLRSVHWGNVRSMG